MPGAAVIDLRAGEGGNADADAAGYVDDELAIVVTTYGNGRHVFLDPYMGTQGCVAAAARRVAATGAMPVAVTNGLNFGNPEKPHTYWQLERSLTGMADACRALDTPVTGGNASLFNETDGQAVHPTPIIGMVGVLPAADKGLPTGFQQAGNAVMLLGNDGAELGGSEYAAVWHGVVAGPPPSVDLKAEKQLYTLMRQLANYGLPVAAHAVTDGGLAVALAEMAMAAAPGAAGCHVTVDDRTHRRWGTGAVRCVVQRKPRPNHHRSAHPRGGHHRRIGGSRGCTVSGAGSRGRRRRPHPRFRWRAAHCPVHGALGQSAAGGDSVSGVFGIFGHPRPGS